MFISTYRYILNTINFGGGCFCLSTTIHSIFQEENLRRICFSSITFTQHYIFNSCIYVHMIYVHICRDFGCSLFQEYGYIALWSIGYYIIPLKELMSAVSWSLVVLLITWTCGYRKNNFPFSIKANIGDGYQLLLWSCKRSNSMTTEKEKLTKTF